jgi:hypothetical protein
MPPYSRNDEFVCAECFGDQGMKDFCTFHATKAVCDFCGAKGSEPIAAPFDEVIEHISATIHRYYDDPANAGLPYESREGGWQGETLYTYEVFDALGLDFPKDEDDRLRDAIAFGLDNELWSDAEPFVLSRDQILEFSWERFCRVVKHEQRYFFMQEKKKREWPDHDELYSPAKILKTIFAFAKEAGAFVPMPAGTKLFRARYQPTDEVYATAGTLGPPPEDHAIKTNRMSPPGVVMTYAAEDRETALAETADAAGTFAIGEFTIDRELLILDLTRLPAAPSVFAELPDSLEYDPRPRLNFLHSISAEISRPIARDDRVHVEYVPTQVVTEYVRTIVRIEGRKVDGIRYSSSRHHAATAVVLFADQSNLILERGERPDYYRTEERWLRLVKASAVDVTDDNFRRWAAKPCRNLLDIPEQS